MTTVPALLIVNILLLMGMEAVAVEVGSTLKVTGCPDAPPLATSVIGPTPKVTGDETLKVMVCEAAVPVSVKLAGALAPITLAVTVRAPIALVCAVICAWPRELVTAGFPDGKLTPVPAKVTDASGTRLPNASCTMTVSGLVKSAPYRSEERRVGKECRSR